MLKSIHIRDRKMYDIILFDLDGTLTDPGEGITNSVAYALEKCGIPAPERSRLYKFIGPPLMDSFKMFYGFSEEQARKAVSYYREHFQEKGIWENQVYDGVEEMLKTLRNVGKRLLVATSKPELFARQILEHFDLAQYFEYIAGATMNETRNSKDAVIAYALESCHVTDLSRTVMVGDREYDILGAKKVGLPAIGVLFGYGSEEELHAAGAAALAEKVEDICGLVM